MSWLAIDRHNPEAPRIFWLTLTWTWPLKAPAAGLATACDVVVLATYTSPPQSAASTSTVAPG